MLGLSSNAFRFILHGLEHANEVIGENSFDKKDWKVIGEYVYDGQGGRHQAFYAPLKDLTVLGVSIREGEKVKVEQSLKYSAEESAALWQDAGLKEVRSWPCSTEAYSKCLISNPPSLPGKCPE